PAGPRPGWRAGGGLRAGRRRPGAQDGPEDAQICLRRLPRGRGAQHALESGAGLGSFGATATPLDLMVSLSNHEVGSSVAATSSFKLRMRPTRTLCALDPAQGYHPLVPLALDARGLRWRQPMKIRKGLVGTE